MCEGTDAHPDAVSKTIVIPRGGGGRKNTDGVECNPTAKRKNCFCAAGGPEDKTPEETNPGMSRRHKAKKIRDEQGLRRRTCSAVVLRRRSVTRRTFVGIELTI